MAKHIVTNTTDGPKVLNASPSIILQAGETTAEAVEIDAAELAAAKTTEWFEFGAAKAADKNAKD